MWFLKQKNTKRGHASIEGNEGYAFRRSRTLTGSSSPKVAASAPQQSQFKTERLKSHELRQRRLRLARLLILIASVIAVLAAIAGSYIGSTPTIDFAQAKTSHTPPPIADYQKTIEEYLSHHPFERFSFWLNPTQLDAAMRAKHSEILNVGIERNWYGGRLSFTLSLRKPILMWHVGGQRFYVDDKGVAFGYSSFADPAITVTDQSGITPDANGAIASKRLIRFLGKLVAAVNVAGVGKVSGVIIPQSTREVDLRLEGRDYPIKTHIDRDPLQQADDIKNALHYFDMHHITPQYVDVRVASRAFYQNK